MLKELFVDEYSQNVWEPLLPQGLMKKIRTVVKKALKEEIDIPPEAAGAVRDKLGQMDPSFRRLVLYMIEQLGLAEDEKRSRRLSQPGIPWFIRVSSCQSETGLGARTLALPMPCMSFLTS